MRLRAFSSVMVFSQNSMTIFPLESRRGLSFSSSTLTIWPVVRNCSIQTLVRVPVKERNFSPPHGAFIAVYAPVFFSLWKRFIENFDDAILVHEGDVSRADDPAYFL